MFDIDCNLLTGLYSRSLSCNSLCTMMDNGISAMEDHMVIKLDFRIEHFSTNLAEKDPETFNDLHIPDVPTTSMSHKNLCANLEVGTSPVTSHYPASPNEPKVCKLAHGRVWELVNSGLDCWFAANSLSCLLCQKCKTCYYQQFTSYKHI